MADDRHRILIVRLSSLGDVVHGLPVLCALRAHFPAAFIAWLVEDWAAELLQGHPALDRIFTVPRNALHHVNSGWTSVARQAWPLRRSLRAERFDVAVDIQGLTRSALGAWLSGAPKRIGFGGPDGRQRSQLFNNTLVVPTRDHVIDRNLELLAPLGVGTTDVRFGLPKNEDAERHVDTLLAREPVGPRFVVMGIGASVSTKVWPAERSAGLIRHLDEAYGLKTLVIAATPQERTQAAAIAELTPAALVPPRVGLRELAALCRRAQLYVGPDSAPLHVAVAAGARCVGLHGPTRGSRNGPYGAAHAFVQSENGTMDGLSLQAVRDACGLVLSR